MYKKTICLNKTDINEGGFWPDLITFDCSTLTLVKFSAEKRKTIGLIS